jgi:hypothetical protein
LHRRQLQGRPIENCTHDGDEVFPDVHLHHHDGSDCFELLEVHEARIAGDHQNERRRSQTMRCSGYGDAALVGQIEIEEHDVEGSDRQRVTRLPYVRAPESLVTAVPVSSEPRRHPAPRNAGWSSPGEP